MRSLEGETECEICDWTRRFVIRARVQYEREARSAEIRCGGGTGAPPEAVVVGEIFGKFVEWQMASIGLASTLATVFRYRHYPSSSGSDLRSFIIVLKVVYFLFGS